MNVREWYSEALKGNHKSLLLLIEFLVYEKQALKFEDETEKLTYYIQDRFANKMNQYLKEYEVKKREQVRTTDHEASYRHVG